MILLSESKKRNQREVSVSQPASNTKTAAR